MAGRPCVFCRRRPAQVPWEPFCSERCRLQDLSQWIDEGYRVPGEPETSDATSDRQADEDDDEM